MLTDLSANEIAEWEAFNQINPVGAWREDYRTALLISKITNIVNAMHCKKGQKPKVTSPFDFMTDWAGDGRYKKMVKQFEKVSLIEEIKSWAQTHNAAIDRQERKELESQQKVETKKRKMK